MSAFEFYSNCLENDLKILPVPPKSKKPICKWDQAIKSIDELRDLVDKKSNFAFLTGDSNDIVVIDVDQKNGGLDTLELLEKRGFDLFKMSKFIVRSGGGGYHFYFENSPNLEIKTKANESIGIDFRSNGGLIIGPYSTHESGNRYEIVSDNKESLELSSLTQIPEEFMIFLNSLIDETKGKTKLNAKDSSDIVNIVNSSFRNDSENFKEGERNDRFFRFLCKNVKDYTNFEHFKNFALFKNQNLCKPPLSENEITTIVKNVFDNYRPNDSIKEIRTEAYIGPLGEFILKLAPDIEPCKESVLIQSLIMLGNLCDKKFYKDISGSKLYTNQFALILGQTSKARKGTSKRIVEHLFKTAWADDLEVRIKRGLSSGEGLIFSLRDPVYGIREDKKGEQKTILLDQGVENKNAIFYEEEFTRVLKNSKRDTNNITEVIREAYDSGNLSVLTKNDPVTASNTNVSIIAQSTIEEFRNVLKGVDCDNGFYNRFLFCKASRANVIPHPLKLSEIDGYRNFVVQLSKIKTFIKHSNETEMSYSLEAMKLWERLYLETAYSNDINGNLKGRSEDQLQKIAMIYAISECNETIDHRHLLAAKAIVDYGHQTIDQVFNDHIKKKSPEFKIIKRLEQNSPMPRSLIMKEVFRNNISANELDLIREKLIEDNLVLVKKENNLENWYLYEATK